MKTRPEVADAVRDMVRNTPIDGYVACCQALSTAVPSSATSSISPHARACAGPILSHSMTMRLARAGPTSAISRGIACRLLTLGDRDTALAVINMAARWYHLAMAKGEPLAGHTH